MRRERIAESKKHQLKVNAAKTKLAECKFAEEQLAAYMKQAVEQGDAASEELEEDREEANENVKQKRADLREALARMKSPLATLAKLDADTELSVGRN